MFYSINLFDQILYSIILSHLFVDVNSSLNLTNRNRIFYFDNLNRKKRILFSSIREFEFHRFIK